MISREHDKQIKRINQRIVDISKEFRDLPETARTFEHEYKSTIALLIGEGNYHIGSNGAIQINRSNAVEAIPNIDAILERLEGMKTLGQINKEARETLRDEGLKKPSKEEIRRRTRDIQTVTDFFETNKEQFYSIYKEVINELQSTEDLLPEQYQDYIEFTTSYDTFTNRPIGGGRLPYSVLKKIADDYNRADAWLSESNPFEGV